MTHSVLPLAGLLLGLCIGLTSMGGASLMAPFLILVVGVRPTIAVGTDLAYGAITKAIGAAVHWHEDAVDMTFVRRLAIGSVPGGIAGALIVPALTALGYSMDAPIRRAIGVVLSLAAVVLILRWVSTNRSDASTDVPALQGHATTVFGAISGFVVGLTSIGSGALIAAFLACVYPLTPGRVVGTDLVHASILIGATALIHVGSHSVDWTIVSQLLAGSLPGVLIGSWLAPRLPASVLRVGLVSLLLTSGLALI